MTPQDDALMVLGVTPRQCVSAFPLAGDPGVGHVAAVDGGMYVPLVTKHPGSSGAQPVMPASVTGVPGLEALGEHAVVLAEASVMKRTPATRQLMFAT